MASPALAHGGSAAAEALYFEDQELQAINANFGLLTKTDEGFDWSCFDTLTQIPFVGYFHQGSWFASTRAGLFESQDSGCTWAAVEGPMRGRPVVALDIANGVLSAMTQRLPGLGQLFVREEGVFVSKGPTLPAGEVLDVMRRSDGRYLALVQDAEAEPALVLSDEEVSTWQQTALLEGLRNPEFVDLTPAENHHALAATRAAAGEVWAIDPNGEVTRRAQLPSPVREGRSQGDEHWLLTVTGVALKAQGNGPFLSAEGPKHCLAATDSDLFACDDVGSGYLVLYRIEGGWQTIQPFASISLAACAASTCGDAWTGLAETFAPKVDAGPVVDAGSPVQPPDGCSCSGSAASWLGVAALLTVRRRRRC